MPHVITSTPMHQWSVVSEKNGTFFLTMENKIFRLSDVSGKMLTHEDLLKLKDLVVEAINSGLGK